MQGHRRPRGSQRSPAIPISPKGGGGATSTSLLLLLHDAHWHRVVVGSRTRHRRARHKHTLTVNNVQDLSGNSIELDSQTQFTFVTVQTKSFQDGVAPAPDYFGRRDVYILENSPDTNLGSTGELGVDGDDPIGSGLDVSTLISWDLSDIPIGAIIESATITINVTNKSSGSYEFYEAMRNWLEDEATWNEPTLGNPWSSPGTRFTSKINSVGGCTGLPTLDSFGTTEVNRTRSPVDKSCPKKSRDG